MNLANDLSSELHQFNLTMSDKLQANIYLS